MTNRRSTQFTITIATLCMAASALVAPIAHAATGDTPLGTPAARSARIAAGPALPAVVASRSSQTVRAATSSTARLVQAARVPAVSPLVLPQIPTGRDSVTRPALKALAAFRAFAHQPSIANFNRYVHLRNAVAGVAARRLGLNQGAMQAAWNKADTAHQFALLSAFTQIGVPYHRISRLPGVGFDCSGLTSWAWDQAGVALSHIANAQIRDIKNVDISAAEAGDIVYFPGHAMMYLGMSTAIIHSPYTGRNVELDVLQYHQYSTRFGDPLPGL